MHPSCLCLPHRRLQHQGPPLRQLSPGSANDLAMLQTALSYSPVIK